MAGVDKLGTIEYFFTHKIWGLEWPDDLRLVGLNFKVSPNGYLAILRFDSEKGPKVAFLSRPGQEKVYRVLQQQNGRDALKYKPDQFRLDDLGKNG